MRQKLKQMIYNKTIEIKELEEKIKDLEAKIRDAVGDPFNRRLEQ